MTDTPKPLPEPWAGLIAYTGAYHSGGFCAEVQTQTACAVKDGLFTAEQMHAYADAAVAAERERLAQLLERTGNDHCAAAIRASKEPTWPT